MAMSEVTMRMNGMTHSVYFFKSGETTVYDLKIKIENFARINREDQLLFLGPNPLIENHRTLSLYGIVDGSIIDLHMKHNDSSFLVTVISNNGVVLIDPIPCSAYDDVSKIKEHIEIKIGVFSGRQSLLFQDEELSDSDLVRDFSVTLSPTVNLVLNPNYIEEMFDVWIVDGNNGRLIREVTVHPNDRVSLMDWTVRKLEETRGRSFRLFFGEETPEGLETLAALDVRRYSVFRVMFNN